MIKLSRINGMPFFLNAELIEQIESTPDTVLTLVNGKTIMVAEPVEKVLKRIMAYRSRIFRGIRVRRTKKGKEKC